jgi:Lrp/AsnC family transcriptional regulator for asnA, asnC and gidA
LKLEVSTITILSRIKKLEKKEISLECTAIMDHGKIRYSLADVIKIIIKKEKITDIDKKYQNLKMFVVCKTLQELQIS